MTQFLTHLVEHQGLLGILLLMAAESCGLPFPSEVIMPVSGILAAAGHLSLALAIAMGTLGNLVGSLVAYTLAALWGEDLLLGPGRWIGIRARHVRTADTWFQRWGLWAVGVGRLLPVIRTYISFPAGMARVPVVPFILATLVGALPWSAALALAGYALGSRYQEVSGPLGKLALVMVVVVVAVLVAWYWRGRPSRAGS